MSESRRSLAALSLLLLSALPSCASIVSSSSWPVSISTHPVNATVEVYNSAGTFIHKGRSPFTITLPSGDGWFGASTYRLRAISDAGTVTQTELHARLNGWYFGNLLFGGIIGLLIVDPATGAMYRLPETLTIRCGAARP